MSKINNSPTSGSSSRLAVTSSWKGELLTQLHPRRRDISLWVPINLSSAYKGVFSGEQKTKRHPFLLIISLSKHTSQRDLFQLRSTLQIICSGRTSLPESFALCVGLNYLLTGLMPLHSLRKPIPKHPSSCPVDRAFFFHFPSKYTHMFFSLGCTQSPALCAAPGTKTSTVGLNLPFSKISFSSFEQNKVFSIFVVKMIQEVEWQCIEPSAPLPLQFGVHFPA